MSVARRLEAKTILVTGAASGIGEACVERLAAEGATVLAADINERAGSALRERFGPAVEFLLLDVASEPSWERAMAALEADDRRLDGVCNIAGIAAEVEDLERCSLEDWHRVLGVNLEGVFLGCRYAVRSLRARGGSIVNLASIIGLIGDGGMVAYAASKGGVRLLSRSVAVYCSAAGYAVRCNSVHPGYIETPMVEEFLSQRSDPAAARAALVAKHPMGRLGRAHEVAALVAYLQSEEAAFVNGAELTVDGGYVCA